MFTIDRTCIQNVKINWFGWKYHGICDIEMISIEPWAFGKFECVAKCKLCGARYETFGVAHHKLIRAGFSPEKWPVLK